jgi:hypothetical protein
MEHVKLIITDYDDNESDPCFIFEITSGSICVTATYEEPTQVSKNNWNNFIICLELGTSSKLSFCDSNGEVFIKTTDGITTFIVAKYGAGGDGKICITVPNELAFTAMREAVDYINKHF